MLLQQEASPSDKPQQPRSSQTPALTAPAQPTPPGRGTLSAHSSPGPPAPSAFRPGTSPVIREEEATPTPRCLITDPRAVWPQGGLAPCPHSAGWGRSGPTGLRGSSSPQRSEDKRQDRGCASPPQPWPTSWQRGSLLHERPPPSSPCPAPSQQLSFTASPCPTSLSSRNPPGSQRCPHSSRHSGDTPQQGEICWGQLNGMGQPRTVWGLQSHCRQGCMQHQGCHLQMSPRAVTAPGEAPLSLQGQAPAPAMQQLSQELRLGRSWAPLLAALLPVREVTCLEQSSFSIRAGGC